MMRKEESDEIQGSRRSKSRYPNESRSSIFKTQRGIQSENCSDLFCHSKVKCHSIHYGNPDSTQPGRRNKGYLPARTPFPSMNIAVKTTANP
jgi:hypothetical protein